MVNAVDTDVVVVAHNPGDMVIEAVASAKEQARGGQVVVIDSGTNDGSLESLRAGESNVRVIRTPNRGFAAACNVGIRETRGDQVLLLNPDAVMLPGALSAMRKTMDDDASVGIVGAALLNLDGSIQEGGWGRFPTVSSAAVHHLWRYVRQHTGNGALSPRLPGAATPVDWVSGAAMLVRRSAIEDVGDMDDGFFLYYEDVDWCHRFADRGWRVVLEPSALVAHALGTSGAPSEAVGSAYRASFYRYCDLYGLRWLAALARVGLRIRRARGWER